MVLGPIGGRKDQRGAAVGLHGPRIRSELPRLGSGSIHALFRLFPAHTPHTVADTEEALRAAGPWSATVFLFLSWRLSVGYLRNTFGKEGLLHALRHLLKHVVDRLCGT